MPAEFEHLVAKLKSQGKADNPFALARYILGSDKQIASGVRPRHGRRRRAKSKRPR